jgi:hypothetical protein
VTAADERSTEIAALADRIKDRSVAYEVARHYGIALSIDHIDISRMERMAELLVQMDTESTGTADRLAALLDAIGRLIPWAESYRMHHVVIALRGLLDADAAAAARGDQ